MTSTTTPYPVAGLLALALSTTACIELDPGEPADTESGTAGTTSGTAGTASGTAGTASGTVDSDGATDGATDGGPDTICEDTHPDVDASLTIDVSEWLEVGMEGLDIVTTCTVLAVDSAGSVTTTLECDDEGTPRGLSFTIPATDDPVAWGAGESIEVVHHYYPESIDTYEHRAELTVHRSTDGALLLVWIDGNVTSPGIFDPVVWTLDRERCEPPDPTDFDASWPMVSSFDNGLGEVLELGHEQRGTLTPPTGEGILAIDVGWSIYATCCHEQDGWRMVLLRRTTGA